MRLAMIADWLVTYGGAEHVLLEFARVWPDAPLMTTVAARGRLGALRDSSIEATRLQAPYLLLRKHQALLPWMPRAIENMDLGEFDVLLSSSHAVGKGIIPPPHALHICYCHTPMRYAWEMEEEYLKDFRIPRSLQPNIRRKLRTLRQWDLTTAKRVDLFLANSRTTSERISRIYNRESIVVHPPVSDRFFDMPLKQAGVTLSKSVLSSVKGLKGDISVSRQALPTGGQARHDMPFLAFGRLVPYKRFDFLIEAANTLKFPLQIAGTGQDEARLKKLAGDSVKFLGYVAEEELPSLYQNARALLFPQIEDAGLVPLEAMACGTPVIAYGRGGALDTVSEGTSGLFFPERTTESLQGALNAFEARAWDSEDIREHARQFSSSAFQKKIKEIVEKAWESHHARLTPRPAHLRSPLQALPARPQA